MLCNSDSLNQCSFLVKEKEESYAVSPFRVLDLKIPEKLKISG
jgi:hypothetical protein